MDKRTITVGMLKKCVSWQALLLINIKCNLVKKPYTKKLKISSFGNTEDSYSTIERTMHNNTH